MIKNNSFLFSYDCVHQLCIKWTDAMLITTKGLSLSIFYFGKVKSKLHKQNSAHIMCASFHDKSIWSTPHLNQKRSGSL